MGISSKSTLEGAQKERICRLAGDAGLLSKEKILREKETHISTYAVPNGQMGACVATVHGVGKNSSYQATECAHTHTHISQYQKCWVATSYHILWPELRVSDNTPVRTDISSNGEVRIKENGLK